MWILFHFTISHLFLFLFFFLAKHFLNLSCGVCWNYVLLFDWSFSLHNNRFVLDDSFLPFGCLEIQGKKILGTMDKCVRLTQISKELTIN